MRFALLLFLLLPCLASAQDASGTVRRWSEAQALTRSAPTASCLATSSPEGMDARGARAYVLEVEAASGQTLSGAGNLRAYYYDFSWAAWVRIPALDVATSTASIRRLAFAPVAWLPRTGCLLFAADGVTVSGGTVTVRLTAWTGGA